MTDIYQRIEAEIPVLRRYARALIRNLTDYQPPVPRDVMEAQIRLAVKEASDWDFVPQAFRAYR